MEYDISGLCRRRYSLKRWARIYAVTGALSAATGLYGIAHADVPTFAGAAAGVSVSMLGRLESKRRYHDLCAILADCSLCR